MRLFILLVCSSFISVSAFAGKIRMIEVSSKRMEPIYLKLGQSTVLRFRETPKKVVVGNQNYFNVEFIGNDITIQPQGAVKTNLFVYGEYHTFGFILNAGNYSQYDDLVNVRWKSPRLQLKKKRKLSQKNVRKKISLKSKIICETKSITEIRPSVYVLDFKIINKGKKEVKINDIDLFLTRSKVKLPNQRLIFSSDKVEKGLGIEGRIFFKLVKKEGFTLHLLNSSESLKTIISRNFL
ncbi:MAG: hypothetical protein H6622_08220 [Halobacteriovoraceae bacterium]|nr:hypothetical protein [Halobacteriovoraceae bacterium]